MKAVLKVCNMDSSNDVANVRNAISNNEGVVACKIDKQSGEVEIIYDSYFVNTDKLIESIENVGYTVI
jgi:copper chaperone CopZ